SAAASLGSADLACRSAAARVRRQWPCFFDVGVWVMTTMTTTSESLTDTREMFAAHSLFRREFGLSPGLVRAVTAGGMARAALVTRHLDLLVTVLTVHHAAEDEHLWPRL